MMNNVKKAVSQGVQTFNNIMVTDSQNTHSAECLVMRVPVGGKTPVLAGLAIPFIFWHVESAWLRTVHNVFLACKAN